MIYFIGAGPGAADLITVKGKGWEDFKLKISMVRENGNWMVADVQTAIKND